MSNSFFNLELEKTLLGYLILRPDFVPSVDEDLFYSSPNQKIFKKIVELFYKKEKPSLELLTAECPNVKASEIASLLDGLHNINLEHINSILNKLLDLRAKRKIHLYTMQIQKHLKEGDDEAVFEAIEMLKNERGGAKVSEDECSIDFILKAYEEYKDRGGGIQFGIPTLDKLMGGIAEGEVLYVIGRAKVAKSVIAQNVLRHFSLYNRDKGAIFFSLEMPPAQLGERTLMIETNMDKHDIKALTEDTKLEIKKRHENIFYVTRATLTLGEIHKVINQFKCRADIKLVVIDFLSRIQTDITEEYDFLRKATKTIKDMAKELGISIIVIAQTGREGGGSGYTPLTLRSGRGSGTIEEDADFILGVYRPELNPLLKEAERLKVRDTVKLQILGSRRTDVIPDIELSFNKRSLRVTEMYKAEVKNEDST